MTSFIGFTTCLNPLSKSSGSSEAPIARAVSTNRSRWGFSARCGGTRKITNLTRIDHRERQVRAGKCRRHRDLEASGGFEHDQGWGQPA